MAMVLSTLNFFIRRWSLRMDTDRHLELVLMRMELGLVCVVVSCSWAWDGSCLGRSPLQLCQWILLMSQHCPGVARAQRSCALTFSLPIVWHIAQHYLGFCCEDVVQEGMQEGMFHCQMQFLSSDQGKLADGRMEWWNRRWVFCFGQYWLSDWSWQRYNLFVWILLSRSGHFAGCDLPWVTMDVSSVVGHGFLNRLVWPIQVGFWQ